jgi:HK97 gp10 family phage protein
MAINWNDQAIKDRARAAVMRGVIKSTEAVRNEAISLILNTEKTGRVYQRHGVKHQASAPGEPFASDTGQAVNSLYTTYDFTELTGSVISNDPKFPYLEFGTQKMEPRPSLRPALVNMQPTIAATIQAELENEFK